MNQPDTPDSKKKQIISNLDIKSIFVKNIKDEIKKIFYNIDLTGNGVKGEGDFIKTITSYLRRSKAASQKAESAKQVKTQESAVIKQFAFLLMSPVHLESSIFEPTSKHLCFHPETQVFLFGHTSH